MIDIFHEENLFPASIIIIIIGFCFGMYYSYDYENTNSHICKDHGFDGFQERLKNKISCYKQTEEFSKEAGLNIYAREYYLIEVKDEN